MKINLKSNNMAMFMVCEAICEDRKEFANIKPDENGLYDITIILNGTEINAERFLQSLQRSYTDAVKEHASALLSSEYDKILKNIYEIQEALTHHNELFEEKVYYTYKEETK